MPKSKQKKKKKVSIHSITLIMLVSVMALVIIGVVGKLTFDAVARQQKITQQKATLNQTLADVTTFYDKFAQSSNYQKELTRRPENRCSRIGVKGPTKVYTCGTRGEISFPNGNEGVFKKIADLLERSVPNSFNVKEVGEIKEDTLEDAQYVQIFLTHKDTGQECDVDGFFYREKEDFTDQPNEIRFSFDCNLNTTTQLFELEDYDKPLF